MGKALEAVLKQSSVQKELTQSLEDMRKLRDDFNEEARTCEIEMQGQLKSMLQVTNSNAKELQEKIALMQNFMLVSRDEGTRAQQFIREGALSIQKWIESMNKTQETQQNTLDQTLGLLKSNPYQKK